MTYDIETYEPPTITLLGNVADVTQKTAGPPDSAGFIMDLGSN